VRVEVITATKHGSTPEIGEAIAKRLRERGHGATARGAEAVAELPPDAAIVLGSPIYMGKWLKPARELAERIAAEPPGRALWMFSAGPIGDPPKPDDASPEEEVERIAAERAIEHRMLTGKLDRSGLSRMERLAIRAVKVPEGDYRDFEAIAAWADQIAEALDRRGPDSGA